MKDRGDRNIPERFEYSSYRKWMTVIFSSGVQKTTAIRLGIKSAATSNLHIDVYMGKLLMN